MAADEQRLRISRNCVACGTGRRDYAQPSTSRLWPVARICLQTLESAVQGRVREALYSYLMTRRIERAMALCRGA